ncbi:MAG: DUF4276 family protein [Planctomycetes bacterium]|nr:DUF4276 family protein [Planctomycetota bacterium]
MSKGLVVVEGHGEVEAVANLVHRLWRAQGHPFLNWQVNRWPKLSTDDGIRRACSFARSIRAVAMLVLRDNEDSCPKDDGPRLAKIVREEALSIPAAVVLLYREYEVLFLPCLERMAGVTLKDDRGVERPGLVVGTRFEGNYESVRDVKGWLSDHFPQGRSYKPTLDQLPMTRLIELEVLRTSGLPCFGTLERALTFLAQAVARSVGGVYPA